jgi:hypothetical protein
MILRIFETFALATPIGKRGVRGFPEIPDIKGYP